MVEITSTKDFGCCSLLCISFKSSIVNVRVFSFALLLSSYKNCQYFSFLSLLNDFLSLEIFLLTLIIIFYSSYSKIMYRSYPNVKPVANRYLEHKIFLKAQVDYENNVNLHLSYLFNIIEV